MVKTEQQNKVHRRWLGQGKTCKLVLISRITLLGWVTCFTRGLHVGGGANATSIQKVSKARATVLLAWIWPAGATTAHQTNEENDGNHAKASLYLKGASEKGSSL